MFEHGGRRYHIEDVARFMDSGRRESIHLSLAPCSDQTFWDAFVSETSDAEVDRIIACATEASGEFDQ